MNPGCESPLEASRTGQGECIPLWRRAILRALRVSVRYTASSGRLLGTRPTIFTCNHQSLIDGVLIALASPRPLVFAVNVDHAQTNTVTRTGLRVLSSLGLGEVVAVDDSRPCGIRQLVKALKQGQSVMVFPEGRISKDGRPSEAMPGVAWMAQRTGAAAHPLRIRGAHRSRWFAKTGTDLWPRIWLRF